MAEVRWSDHAMERLREQVRYIAEQSQSNFALGFVAFGADHCRLARGLVVG